MDISDFIKNYSYYYQKISICLILANSRESSEQFCIFMKIILLRKEDNESYSHYLINRINKKYVNVKFYSLPINSLNEVVTDAINGRVKSDNEVYNFYNYTKSSNGNFHSSVTLETYDNTIDYPGYIFSISHTNGSFSKILHKDFSLTDSNIGIDDYDFHKILRINDDNYFHNNMLFILCPLFIQELTSDTGYKIYRIENKLYPDLDIRLYDKKGNGCENLIQVEKQGVTTIKIPYLESGKKVYLEIHHKEFGRLYYEELYKKEYTSHASSGAEVKQTNVFIVHGHDEGALNELDNILTKEFHLNAIVLSQMASRGSSTLIDKFEREARSASYAFVLLTPDDIVEKENGKYIQARPNVLFELGWFCGKLGRDKVCIIKRQGTQIPTDLNGIMYIEYEKKIAEKFGLIQKELKEAKLII